MSGAYLVLLVLPALIIVASFLIYRLSGHERNP